MILTEERERERETERDREREKEKRGEGCIMNYDTDWHGERVRH